MESIQLNLPLFAVVAAVPVLAHGIEHVAITRLACIGVASAIKERNVQSAVLLGSFLLLSAVGNSITDLIIAAIVIYLTPYIIHYKQDLSLYLVLAELVAWMLVGGLFQDHAHEKSIFLLATAALSLKDCYVNKKDKERAELVQNSISEINFLRAEISSLKQRDSFREFLNNPHTRSRTRELIQKLKNSQAANIRRLCSEQPYIEEGDHDEQIKEDDYLYSFNLDMLADSSNSMGSEVDSAEGPNSSRRSSISNMSGLLNKKLTKNDVRDIIHSLLCRDYLVTKQIENKSDDIDILAVSLDAKNTYTQASTLLPGLSHRFFKRDSHPVRMRSMIELNDQLAECLENMDDWDFDTLSLADVSQDPCFELGYYAFTTLGLMELFGLSNQKLRSFLTAVERGYHKENFYHNSLHAADVTASTIFLIRNGIELSGNLLDLEIFALVVAALGHDIGHPGVNNAFLMATGDDLAYLYNDRSILENMHASRTFQILRRKECNIISKLSKADSQVFRKVVVDTILATDLSQHYEKIRELHSAVEEKKTMDDDAFRTLALQCALKCADLGHGAKKLSIHKKWTDLITQEFFKQGDTERAQGLPVGSLFDRNTVIVSQSQKGFLNFMVRPLFEAFEEFVRETSGVGDAELKLEICNRNISSNIDYWEKEFEALGTSS